jgi:hypothetical protein
MENFLNQFKALTNEEKFAFMKEAMPHMAEIFKSDPEKMMSEMMPVCMNMISEMMPFCMNMMKSKGMDPDMMRSRTKNMMGQP